MIFSKIENIWKIENFRTHRKYWNMWEMIFFNKIRFFKKTKFCKFGKSNCFLLKMKIFKNISPKWPPTKKLKSYGNCIYIITWGSYPAKMKLQYMNFTSVVALTHIMMVLVTKNISQQGHVINKLGRFGTGVPLAPVLATSGEPATWFPLE